MNKRPTIGVIAGWQTYAWTLDSFLDYVYRGIQASARDHGCNLLLACGLGSHYGIGLGRSAWPLAADRLDFVPVGPWNCDGLIVIPPFTSPLQSDFAEALRQQGFPIVYGGDREHGPAIIVDNTGGIHLSLRHLYDHGHRRIAFVAGRRQQLEGDSGIRLRAYLSGLEQLGLEFDPALVAYGHHTYIGGITAVGELLGQGVEFSALLVSNDQSAVGVMEALRDAGVLVPQDVAVIGFDDRIEARAQIPPLTTVHYPMFEMGYETVRLILRAIAGTAEPDELVTIPTRLAIRESCGCVPGVPLQTSASPPARLSDAEVLAAMASAAYAESRSLNLHDITYLCQRLLDALQISRQQQDPTHFLQTLQQILSHVAAHGDDLYPWQGALSLLRNQVLSAPDLFPAAEPFVENLFHLARTTISEISRGRSSRLLVQQGNVTAQLGQLTGLFFGAQSEAELFETVSTGLPEIGVKGVTVAFYESDNAAADPYAWSVLQTPLPQGQADARFPSRQFPPPGLYDPDQPLILSLLPLIEAGAVFGYAGFEAASLDWNAAIVRQLAAALRSIQFYRQAVAARQSAEEGRQLAEEANRLKGRFLSMVSHELRAPLNLIAGLSDTLLRQQPNGSPIRTVNREDLERIYISAQQLDALIRDVLDLARSDVGKLQLVGEPLALQPVLETIALIGAQLAKDKDLGWRCDIPAQLPLVWGDRVRLRQVILNLVNNAIKFTSCGEVVLQVQVGDGELTILVQDTGLGIPAHEQEVIFDEFRQSDRTAARGYGGLGLGLAICKRLVELHQGKIGVRSSGDEGSGSTFFFTLPILVSLPSPQPAPATGAGPAQRVLVLAKNDLAAALLRDYLVPRGFAVDICLVGAGTDWLAALLFAVPDVVVLDLDLTSDRGWEILKVLKENPAMQDIPVLFYTLHGSQDRGSLLEMDYLTKPLSPASLVDSLVTRGLLANRAGPASPAPAPIVLVDDDPAVLELHTRLLRAHLPGHEVLSVTNGRAALELIRRNSPALVLLDLMMSEMDGFAVLEAMRQEEGTRHIPVVVITGQTLTDEDMARLNHGVASVLGKGIYTASETLAHIAAALAHKRKPGSEAQRLILKATAFIHTHYPENISRRDIAAHVGLSERHLTRCFNQELSLTPITYLNRFRVRQAKELLDLGQQGITEIAQSVGFSTSAYFTRVFRDEVGESPRAYQRRNHPRSVPEMQKFVPKV